MKSFKVRDLLVSIQPDEGFNEYKIGMDLHRIAQCAQPSKSIFFAANEDKPNHCPAPSQGCPPPISKKPVCNKEPSKCKEPSKKCANATRKTPKSIKESLKETAALNELKKAIASLQTIAEHVL